MELHIKSKRHPGMVKKMGQIARKKVKHKPTGDELVITNLDLDIFWSLIFLDVTPERVAEYESVQREVDRRRKEYEAKKEYEAQRASDSLSPRDTLRHRDEALYHNQDPAVQVVEGFVEAEMATTYDLEQARMRRERAEHEMTAGMKRSK